MIYNEKGNAYFPSDNKRKELTGNNPHTIRNMRGTIKSQYIPGPLTPLSMIEILNVLLAYIWPAIYALLIKLYIYGLIYDLIFNILYFYIILYFIHVWFILASNTHPFCQYLTPRNRMKVSPQENFPPYKARVWTFSRSALITGVYMTQHPHELLRKSLKVLNFIQDLY